MLLGDKRLKSCIEDDGIDFSIDPYIESNVEPASVDLRLSNDFTKIIPTDRVIDTHDETSVEHRHFSVEELELYPGETILGSTIETVSIPDFLIGNVVGRSSLGRLDVVIHKTAGFIDPGFTGEITLEIENEGEHPVKLYAGDRVCQMWVAYVTDVEVPYGEERGSQYQNQSGATPSGMEF